MEEKLDEALAILKRIEAKLNEVEKEVEQVQEQEAPVVGSFGTTEPPPVTPS